ncbi:MAG: hypothetical protein K2X82_20710 [Gemmataceae bacterium]|nr:hypothetical protein [Gemmataceae bacterium]
MQVSPAEPAATGLAQLASTALRAAVEAVVPTAGTAAPVPDTVAPVALAVVEVLAAEPDGRVRVAVDGRAEVATSAEPLTPGGRYVLQVERGSSGLVLTRPAESPELPAAVAAAVLRASAPPDLGPTLQGVLGELAALPPGPVQQAAVGVRDTIRNLLTENGPPDAAQLRNFIENGGLHFEAKLGRFIREGEAPVGGPTVREGLTRAPSLTVGPPTEEGVPDLKGGLLRLLHAARDLGGAVPLAATRAALDGIEANQAANVLAREQGTPYVLQVPFPDGPAWRTLRLAVEPDRPGSDEPDGRPNGFRMLMHVPLSGLGETWIDAGLSGDRFRAVLYLDAAPARDRVRADLPALRADLAAGGFGEVLLDVRAAADLPARRRQLAAAMAAGRPADGSVLDVRA